MTIDEVKRELFSSSEDVLGNDMVDLYEAQECCDTSFNIGYNKAIDDIVIKIKERVGMDWEWDFMFIEQITEQLKAGEQNEQR